MNSSNTEEKDMLNIYDKFLVYHLRHQAVSTFILILFAATLSYVFYAYILESYEFLARLAISIIPLLFVCLFSAFTHIKKDQMIYNLVIKIAKKITQLALEKGKYPTSTAIFAEYNIDPDLAKEVIYYLERSGLLKEIITIEKIQKEIVELSEKYGGILTVSKAYVDLKYPLDLIKNAFRRLHALGIIKKISETLYDFRGIRTFSNEEKKIIQLIEQFGGVVTAEQLAKELNENLDKVNLILEDFENKGLAIKAIEKGVRKWYFPGILKSKINNKQHANS